MRMHIFNLVFFHFIFFHSPSRHVFMNALSHLHKKGALVDREKVILEFTVPPSFSEHGCAWAYHDGLYGTVQHSNIGT